MTNQDTLIKQLIEEVKKNFLLKGGCCYGFLDISTRQEELIFDNELFPFKEDFYLTKESYFFIKKALYNALFLKNKKELAFNLSQSTAYVSIAIQTINRHLCDCSHDGGHRYRESMHEIVPLLSMPILTNEWDMSEVLCQELADSLNAKSCIIERGDFDAMSAWFTMKLLTQFFNIPLDKRKPRYPNKEDFKHYQDVLDKWDSEDMIEVDKMSYFLAELHLNEFKDKWYINKLLIQSYFIQLFPYEILTWLKLRERAGIKNPKTFTHPLMNTPIAKMFLNIKEPLPYPTELPYAKELLEKLKEQCPDVEIPEWLEEIAYKDTIPEDFMK